MVNKTIVTLFSLILFFILAGMVSATDCWILNNDQSSCTAADDCQWKSDNWGSWCEQLNCWSLNSQDDCTTTSIPNKNCTWQSSVGWGWCEQTMCSSFDGTNNATCEGNSDGLTCDWQGSCYGWNPDVNCYNIASQSTCGNTSGCNWGRCDQVGCWSADNSAECATASGSMGQACAWNSASNYCYEVSCWSYTGTNQSACINNAQGMTCNWVNDQYHYKQCEEPSCWQYDFTDQLTCESTSGLNCTWNSGKSMCEMQGCWNYNIESNCNGATGCSWKNSYGSGWCEEVQCWLWDGWKGGDANACVNNSYGLNCAWDDAYSGCYPNLDTSCANITSEKACMDTFYCWWQYTDWNNVSAGGNCNDPGSFGGMVDTTFFSSDNPGCYIYDGNQTNCESIIGCEYSNGECNSAVGHAYESYINSNGINCTIINTTALCNDISALGSCCSWSNGNCAEAKADNSCKEKATKSLENLGFGKTPACRDVAMTAADDAAAQVMCNKLRTDVGLPCKWYNDTNECKVTADLQNKTCDTYDNDKLCSGAGCKWVAENYCNGDVSVPIGRCEAKGNSETNCKQACYACDYKFDGTNHSSAAANKQYCEGENPKCEFTADATAYNGFGWCKAKEKFKNGVYGDCKTSCGSCTGMGQPDAANQYSGSSKSFSTCLTPKCFCEQASEFDYVKCKWVADDNKAEGGNCVDSSERVCADACDRCETRDDCANKGRSAMNATGSCSWSGSDEDGACTKAGESTEICWDGIDNDNDGDVDCADSSCFSDSFCGFVSGDCFAWSTQAACQAAQLDNGLNCTWVSDAWGSWCDFPGSDCWKLDGNSTGCSARADCDWSSGDGNSWCEQDWSIGEVCYSAQSETACGLAGDCSWQNDTWCSGAGSTTDWCQSNGGWCNPTAFAPANCWQYDTNSTACATADKCAWQSKEWGPSCEVDWSANCWNYADSDSCAGDSNCAWRTSSGGSGSWCGNKFDKCWDYSTSGTCAADSNCFWDSYDQWNSCKAKCWDPDNNDASSCNAVSGCMWSEGWCMEDWSTGTGNCWDYASVETGCNATNNCKWKGSGWCNPKGFAGGDASGGSGSGSKTGMECWKYDGNQTACTNNTLIGMTCSWMEEFRPMCEPDWSVECWQNYNRTDCTIGGCYWNGASETDGWCSNTFDQCFMNITLSMNETLCNANTFCNWTNASFGGFDDGFGGGGFFEGMGIQDFGGLGNGGGRCEPSCFQASTEATCGSSCRWMTGWCNPPGMVEMFVGMENGPPAIIANDDCSGNENINAYVDLCGVGVKDMGDAFGFGSGVKDISQAGVCNNEMIGFGNNQVSGNGQQTTKFYVYMDTDGLTSGGCALSHNNSAVGYEFMFKYIAEWNGNLSKVVETFNPYRCKSGGWEAADITLSTWKKKMCSEIQGLMIAVNKKGLEKYPTLYDTTNDFRIYVATANLTTDVTSPTDTAGPGWFTAGAVDFAINSFSDAGADMSKYEDIFKDGYVKHEDCYSTGDDDDDGLTNCDDWDCESSPNCASTGVNAAGYADTSMPKVNGIKIETYPDSALVMYDTNKPTNGTLFFYYNDSTCTSVNTTIYDAGVIKTTVKNSKLWHSGELYNDGGIASLNYALALNTTYYYKLKVCDSNSKCAVSACTSFSTPVTVAECSYCNFVTRINAPTGWNVYYDLDQDGTYEHWQGNVCGPNAGMKTNYTTGRRANIKLNHSDEGDLYFYNVTLTKTGLTSTTRSINTAGDLILDTTLTDAAGNAIGGIGMFYTTRDKIINNLHPEICQITVPNPSGVCNKLYHCDDSGNNCEDRTAEASLITSTATTCTWQLPYCEFSMWASGEPGTPSSSSSSSSSSGSGGGGGGGAATGLTYIITEEQFIAGTTKELAVADKIKFPLDDDTDFITLVSASSSSAKINLSSGKMISVSMGSTGKYELTGDNYYDLSVKYVSYNSTSGKATLTLKKLNELFKVTAAPTEEKPAAETTEETVGSVTEPIKEVIVEDIVDEKEAPALVGKAWSQAGKVLLDLSWLWITLVIVGIVIWLSIYFYHKRNE
ncbi:MAG: hypothetical protein ABH824_01485 [Nanoarchaeota archaeon]